MTKYDAKLCLILNMLVLSRSVVFEAQFRVLVIRPAAGLKPHFVFFCIIIEMRFIIFLI